MPSCVVKICRNNTGLMKKCQGITFHKFPKNDVWRNDWIQILRECRNESHWNPSNSSVICNTHFDASDFYTTKAGLMRLVTFAVPQKFLNEAPTTQEPTQENSHSQTPKDSYESTIIPNRLNEANIARATLQSSSVTRAVVSGSGQQLSLGSSLPSRTTFSLPQISYELLTVRENQPTDAYIPSATYEVTPKTEAATAFRTTQPSTDLKKQKLKYCNSEKMQTLMEKQKNKIKMLHQKVRRLQKRNKSLKDMIVKKVIKKNASDSITSKKKKIRDQREEVPEEIPACVECGVEMDGCELYRCVQCPLVVMCAKCARINAHAHHCVMRIPSLQVYNKIDSIFGLFRELTNKLSKEDNDQTCGDENYDDSEGNVFIAESKTSDPLNECDDAEFHEESPTVLASIKQENSSRDEDDKSHVLITASEYQLVIDPGLLATPLNESVPAELKTEKRKATHEQTPENTKMMKYHDSGALQESGTTASREIKQELEEIIEIKKEKFDDYDLLETKQQNATYRHNVDFSNR